MQRIRVHVEWLTSNYAFCLNCEVLTQYMDLVATGSLKDHFRTTSTTAASSTRTVEESLQNIFSSHSM